MLLQSGDYDYTFKVFNTLNNKFKDSDFADASEYLAGLCLYLRGDYRGSSTQLDRFVKRYPRSTLVPYGMFWSAWSKLKDGKGEARSLSSSW